MIFLTHRVERTKLGQQLEQIVRSSMGAEFDAAVQAKLAEYQNYGKKLDEPRARHEVVAQWLGKNLYQNGFAQAVVNGDAKVGNVILRTLDQVRLALGGTQKSRTAANIAIVERLFMRALQQSPALDNSGEVQFSFIGVDRDGRRKYESGFGDDVPMETREKLFKERIATIFNLGAVELRTDVKKIVVNGDRFTAKKNLRGDAYATQEEFQAKINALYDLADILQTSEYLPDKTQKEPSYEDPTIPPKNDAHKGVKYWYKFQNKIELDGTPYTVTFNIRDKGKEQYQYLIDFKKEGHLVNHTTANSLRQAYQMPTDSTVPQNDGGVNTQYMQNGTKNSQSSFEGSDEIAEAVALMERERAEKSSAASASGNTVSTSSVTADAVTPSHQGEGNVAIEGQPETVGNIPSPLESGRVSEGTVSQAQTVEELTAEIGDEAVYRRMYYAAQIDRPPATLEIDGQTVNTTAYMDELYMSLPDDDLQLTAYLKEREAEKAAQVAERFTRGETGAEWTEVDLQILTARSKLEWSELGDSGESGSKTRRFYEQRLKGKDVNKAHETELLELLAGRSETYSPISNQKTFNEMQKKLREDADYKARLQKRILRYKPNDLFNAKDAAAAQIMINDARNNGDLELYADLVQGLSRKGTELGRAVQVLSMQRRMTPEGTLKAAQRTLRSQADRAMYDGANEDLDIFAERITDAIERAAANKTTETADSAQGRGAVPRIVDLSNDNELASEIQGVFGKDKYYKIRDYILNALVKQPFRLQDGTQVVVDRSDARHIASGAANKKTAQIAKIQELVKNAQFCADDTQVEHNKFDYFRYYEVYVKYGNETFPIYLNVGKAKNDGSYHLYDITQNLRDTAGRINGLERPKPNEGYALENGISTDTIPQNVDGVNNQHMQGSSEYAPMTRDELTEALAQDITGDNSPYITADEIRGILERAVESASDIPDQLKRYLKKNLGSDMGTLAQRIAKMHEAGYDKVSRRKARKIDGFSPLFR